MDNFMDRLVERMNDREPGYDEERPSADEGRYSSAPRGRMDYAEPDDSYGYGRPQRSGGAPSVGRRDLEELGRAVISAQKKMSDDHNGVLESMKGALVDQAKGLDEGFKEQNGKIESGSQKILQAIQALGAEVKSCAGAQGGALTRSDVEQMLETSSADIAAKSADAIHKEDVKLYKNVQAIVEENAGNITKAINAGSTKTAEEVAASLSSLSQLEKINELEAALAETKEELLNRTSGLKSKVTVAMLFSIINFVGVAVLVAIAFGFL